MLTLPWVQFSWNLTKLPSSSPSIASYYQLDRAKATDASELEVTINRSFSSESGWSTDLPSQVQKIRKLIVEKLPDQTVEFFLIRHGSRIVAASGVCDNPETENHLLPGVCVLDEYRCRGIGTFLLYESLKQLKESGLENVRAIARKNLTAERYLYSKFGSIRKELF